MGTLTAGSVPQGCLTSSVSTESYRFPFAPYPSGWFRVAFSGDIKPKSVTVAKYFGIELIVFRGESGAVSVVEPYCPHLGANLGVGATVVGDAIQCPFHGWRFNIKGDCVHIPYSKRPHQGAKLDVWPTREVNGLIMAYHDPARAAPAFDVPTLTEFASSHWTRPRRLVWKVRTHLQELAENVVDIGHFNSVHAWKNFPVIDSLEIDEHRLTAEMTSRRKVAFKEFPASFRFEYFGLGLALATTCSGGVELLTLVSETPVDEEHLEVCFLFTVKKRAIPFYNQLITEICRREMKREFESDVPVLENKRYLANPRLCESDGPIHQVRTWTTQFYAKSPPSSGS